MADFDDLRAKLNTTRSALDDLQGEIAALRARLKRLEDEDAAAARRFNPRDEADLAARARRAADIRRLASELSALREREKIALTDEIRIRTDFADFTDPRRGIANLGDATPILMMPIRLETRFKPARETGAGSDELWLRVYPDDCFITTFDPALTAAEAADARSYWAGIWSAGGHEDEERAAWRAIATTHGAGRAGWIVDQFPEIAASARPTKPRPQDIILTVATETPLPAAEAAALAPFWQAAWRAQGDATALTAARSALEEVVGPGRAAALAAETLPVNFAVAPVAGTDPASLNVAVAFLVFPPVETKESAWASAPKMTLLPDRFVFIGYRGNAAPRIVLGNPVPATLFVGPDPQADAASQIHHDDDGHIAMPDALKWITDFPQAVEDGMGLRIALDPDEAKGGFDRVLVVGLRLCADATEGAAQFAALLRGHACGRTGLAVLPQGTPTNNTETVSSGHARLDDPDATFDDRKSALFTPDADWLDKRDGEWLADYLGIDKQVFAHVHGAGATDQIAARAMNTALWPATLGYWMESLMSPVFPRRVIEQTRSFFNRYVIAGGTVPALRIGAQPYGILPATAFSRMAWLDARERPLLRAEDPTLAYLRELRGIIAAFETDWRAMGAGLTHIGKAGDPHQILLDIVGLHSGSVEWSQRYAESLKTVFNRLNLLGLGGLMEQINISVRQAAARQILANLGYAGEEMPEIFDKLFSGRHNLLKGGVVDDLPLSETAPIRAYTPDGRNYIEWLSAASGTSLNALYAQDGFLDDKPPKALLYLMLRHALQLGYHDVGIRLYENAALMTPAAAVLARQDRPFLHIQAANTVSESRYQILHSAEVAITGSAAQTVSDFITAQLPTLSLAFHLRDQREALERLKKEPTARLERVFADHIDCLSYRPDAWLLGLVTYQLTRMRNIADGEDREPRRGLHLGAYGWLEELRPENKHLTPVRLDDHELAADFGDPDAPPLMRDDTNQGYIHAPSLNHAVAAAVLRNGYITNAGEANSQTMAVNLSSERVRTALALLEGVRAGQGLADLLGYQFERGLHDRHGPVEVDKFIYKLRKAFPLRADRMASTRTGEGVSIEAIEARNVIDGLALVNHMKVGGASTYPFGKESLPPATAAEAAAINAEAQALVDAHDAVADLALAEGVYQAVLGNYDRVAATYDAYARGNFPPEPEVVRTPLDGIGLTHRIGLHLDATASPTASPLAGVAMTPRAQAEPALNRWLATVLPAPAQVGCVVAFVEAATGAQRKREVTLADLGLQPSDILALVGHDSEQAMREIDDRILRHVMENFAPRPDKPVTIRYMETKAAPISIFALSPLLRALRQLTTKSRALKPSDLTLMNEATVAQDATPVIEKARLDLVRAAMAALHADLTAFQATLDGPLTDLDNRRGEILDHIDDHVTALVALMARAALFAIPQAGWGVAYDFKRRSYAAVLAQFRERVARWEAQLAVFDATVTAYGALPAETSDDERFRLLVQAEQAISAAATEVLPPTPAAFLADLAMKRAAFVTKQTALKSLDDTTETELVGLLAEAAAHLPIDGFDPLPFTLEEREAEIIRFAEDAALLSARIAAEIERRLTLSQNHFDAHDAAATVTEAATGLEKAAKALLGEDFRIIPTFRLGAGQSSEMANALAASQSGDLFAYLTGQPDPATPAIAPLPVETWLAGIARVRDKLRAFEQIATFTGAFGLDEPELTPLQLPFIPDDRWLALEFPPDLALDKDRLLYSAVFAAPFDGTASQCGLLLDEWTETIPGANATTGIAFHHDRPNTEAPQTMLLVTPTDFRGAWQWDDLVDALNETLDLAKLRAIEPAHIDATPYAPFLPTTVMAAQARQLTIAANLVLNNSFTLVRP
ncbi:conserved hypothetical protein [Hyphomicrobiales bacterium]|nr:conserved hypothetical protein [Hyphomicrobiales bacterium]CAH1694555.1 conserved hypothetical protein [Hyphomicrobiales bacterium]